MGQLLVRHLDDETIRRLKQRAAAHEGSTEAEHRAILQAAMRGTPGMDPIEASRCFRQELTQSGTEGAEIIRQARDARAAQILP